MWKDVMPRELYAFLGILIMSGANNSNTDHTIDMWKATATSFILSGEWESTDFGTSSDLSELMKLIPEMYA